MTRGPDAPRSGPSRNETILHASCVALQGRGVLIRGASGTGKSGLALQLMALGAGLVADDRTCLWRDGNALMADAPEAIRGLIEAREMGVIKAPCTGPTPVALIVDMDSEETMRLPPRREGCLQGADLPLVRKSHLPHFPAAILTYLINGRHA